MARSLSADDGKGHNSGGMIDGEAVKRFVSRVSVLMEEQKAIGDDIKEICAEFAESGHGTSKELRQLARESLKEPEVLSAHLERMDMLRHALGGFADTPLGEAAIDNVAQFNEEADRRVKGSRRSRSKDAMQAAQDHLNGPENELA